MQGSIKIVRTDRLYVREEVARDDGNMYIFTDNTDRDSGRRAIDNHSWYAQKYGTDKHYPTMTTALIRGLDNAYPITTQRYYNKNCKGVNGRWNDSDFEDFKKVIDDDFDTILRNIHRYGSIIFPIGGIFNTKISNISKERTPLLFNYLMGKCLMLNACV